MFHVTESTSGDEPAMQDPRFTVAQGRAFLARHDLLGHLLPEELDRLLASARVERVETGQVLFRKGDPGDKLFVVLAGRIAISAVSGAGKEAVLNVLGPGAVFGEIALLDGRARTADAAAKAESHVLVIERSDFIPFLASHPEVAARLLAVVCERVRWVAESYEDSLFMELPARLAKKLLILAETYGEPVDGGGIRIGFLLSQEELGKMTGVSRESVNKLMRNWQEDGLVAVSHGRVTILDQERLKALVGPE